MTSVNKHHWPFSSTLDDEQVVVRRRGDFGAVREILRLDKYVISNLRPGEAHYYYYKSFGSFSPPSSSTKLVCWHRFKVWWMRPVFCSSNKIPPETILILFHDKEKQQYRVVMTGVSCALSTSGDHESIINGSILLRSSRPNGVELYCGMGVNPYLLIQDGVQQLSSGKPADYINKAQRPSTLGWSTWNAFYTQVSGPSLVKAVETIQQVAPIRWMILDDGWQHTTNDNASNGQQWEERLASLQESPTKFSQLSLKETIATLKSTTTRLDDVWVWHTLMGYWLGVSGESLYFPHFPSGILDNDWSTSKEASVEQGIGIPSTSFFNAYHEYLASCGVSGVKVDAQGVVASLRPYKWNQEPPSDTEDEDCNVLSELHEALAKNVQLRFCKDETSSPKIIHCMAHTPEIIFGLSNLYKSRPIMRASDDHYPDNPYSHGSHIVACAFNSLLLSPVSVPDWDMFTMDCLTAATDERVVRLHAVSRCLSGGPVYISDPPSRVRQEVVNWICCRDGTVLNCRESALPVAKCLLSDPLAFDSDIFVIFNTNGSDNCVTSGVLGVFHLAGSGAWDYEKLDYGPVGDEKPEKRTVRVRPSDIPHFSQRSEVDTSFLAISFFAPWQVVELPTTSSEFAMELNPLECDAITIVPVHRVGLSFEIVVLGIKGKINGAGSILELRIEDGGVASWVRGCGILQFGIRPYGTAQVQVDGASRDFAKDDVEVAGFVMLSVDLGAADKERRLDISIQQ